MKGFVYRIASPQTDEVYVGSTTQDLHKRLIQHKSSYNNSHKEHHTRSSFEIIKYGDAYIELIEEIEFTDLKELYKCEGKWINELNTCNSQIAGRTKKERDKIYRAKEDNKTERHNYDVKRHQEKGAEIYKKRREDKRTCECGSVVIKSNFHNHLKTDKHKSFLGIN